MERGVWSGAPLRCGWIALVCLCTWENSELSRDYEPAIPLLLSQMSLYELPCGYGDGDLGGHSTDVSMG